MNRAVIKKFLRDNKAVSPVIGTVLMVAVTVVLAAIVGAFVYKIGTPKIAPSINTDFEDDSTAVLQTGSYGQRVGMLTFTSAPATGISEFIVTATFTNTTSDEHTAYMNATNLVASVSKTMESRILAALNITWVDSDGSGTITSGDRFDFYESKSSNTSVGSDVKAGTDFIVRIVHSPTESVVVDQRITVY